jgi:hypothetical protein
LIHRIAATLPSKPQKMLALCAERFRELHWEPAILGDLSCW